MFSKVNCIVWILAKTLYNLNIYIRKIKKLHVVALEWKYINIVKACKLFLSEFEELKSCIYRVQTANAGIGLQWFWHHQFILMLKETVLFTTKRIWKIQYLTRVCNHYPKLTLHFTGLRIYSGKVSLSRVGTYSEGKEPRYRYLSIGIRLFICWRQTLSDLDVFSNNTNLVICNRRHSISQYNEFSNVFWRKSKV